MHYTTIMQILHGLNDLMQPLHSSAQTHVYAFSCASSFARRAFTDTPEASMGRVLEYHAQNLPLLVIHIIIMPHISEERGATQSLVRATLDEAVALLIRAELLYRHCAFIIFP
jgi:hypothetical protein